MSCPYSAVLYSLFFFFNDTATTEIYTLSLHDALPIWSQRERHGRVRQQQGRVLRAVRRHLRRDRKSTRLNSSHSSISYAVFCLKKKKKKHKTADRDITNMHGTTREKQTRYRQ